MPQDRGYHVIIGASSAIAAAIARQLAAEGDPLVLVGRRPDAISPFAQELRDRYRVAVEVLGFDALQPESFPALAEQCCALANNQLSAVVICHGELIFEPESVVRWDDVHRAIQINFTSVAQIVECFVGRLETLRLGQFVVLSSVAGDRGRPSNYLYGAAKAGLTAYTSGLRGRLNRRGIHVLTVKPGLTESRMTMGRFSAGSWLVASPDRVARDIIRAMRRRTNVLYTPWWWRLILLVTLAIPEALFKRLRF